jgi:hypothetical protein
VSNARWVDWTVAPVTRTSGVPKMALSDGKRPLFGWDGSALAPWSGSLTFIPLCVCFFQDRLFCANIIEGGSTFRRRIRWSSITDSSSFIGTPDVQWTDRPYGDGEILRLIPFGKLLAVFYSDGLDIGRPSNYAGDAMPLAFEHVNTGGSGLVGMKAAARFYDGIFCAMEDGFYFLDNNGFKDIGEPIWKYATEDIANFQGTVVQIDWRNRCAVFGVPTNDGTNIGKLWCYNYETKKWSWDDISCTMLGSYLEGNAPTWDGTSGTWDSQTAAWDAFSVAYRKKLSFGRAGKLFLMDPTATRDADGSLIEAVIETGDIDLQLGNFVKTAFQLVLTADRIMTADMSFNIEGSVDRGNTWKALGLLTIGAGTDNNQVTFKLTGATLRFRITHSGLSTPYALPTLDIRVRTRGREAHFG